MNKASLSKFKEHPIVAIVRGIEPSVTSELCEALFKGNIRFTEITLNSEGALDSIFKMREQFDGKMYIGAGSVLDERMAKEAVAAGAEFLVSPNVDRKTIDYARSKDIVTFSGAMTPTEIQMAYSYGATIVKVFPCSSLGSQYIKEIQGPLSHIPMIAVGGIGIENAAEFMQTGAIGIGVGGALINTAWINNRQFDQITTYAYQLNQVINQS